MQDFVLPMDAVVDEPQHTDYDRHEYEEYAEGIKSARPSEYIELLDQDKTSLCTKYALYHIINAYNVLEDIRNEGKLIRDQLDPGKIDDGIRSLQSRVDIAKKLGMIAGYVAIQRVGWRYKDGSIQTKESHLKQIKKAIDSGYFIYTGSANVDWSAGWHNPVLQRKESGVGHAFDLVSDNEVYHSISQLLLIPNSFGLEYGDKGYNYIKEENNDKLFTCYVIIPAVHSSFFQGFRNKQKAKQVVEILTDLYHNGTPDQQKYYEEKHIGTDLKKLYLL